MPTQFFTHQISKNSGLILYCCCFKTHSRTFAGGYAKWYTYMRKKLAFLHTHLLLNLAIKYTSNNIKMHMHSIYCSITCSQKVLEATLISKHRQLTKLQYIHAKAYCAAARKHEKCLSGNVESFLGDRIVFKKQSAQEYVQDAVLYKQEKLKYMSLSLQKSKER